MHDDGKNGDVASADGIYTLQVPFNEAASGEIQLQVSAAFRGALKRTITSPIILAVTPDGSQPLPPDPGSVGKATFAGIDSDGDGVRDDVQRYIASTYSQSARTRAALTQMAQAMQSKMLDASGNRPLIVADTLAWAYAADCLSFVTASSAADVTGMRTARDLANALKTQVLNTPERIQAYYNEDDQLGAWTYNRPTFPDLAGRCAFNPSSLPN